MHRGEGSTLSEDLHVDARAVVGERGQLEGALASWRPPLRLGGANEQLVRGGNKIVIRSARVRARVARGGHDQHLRFEKARCV